MSTTMSPFPSIPTLRSPSNVDERRYREVTLPGSAWNGRIGYVISSDERRVNLQFRGGEKAAFFHSDVRPAAPPPSPPAHKTYTAISMDQRRRLLLLSSPEVVDGIAMAAGTVPATVLRALAGYPMQKRTRLAILAETEEAKCSLVGEATARTAAELACSLGQYHRGADRGELMALLVKLWGPSPAIASDLRGLAARESQADRVIHEYETEPRFVCTCPPETFGVTHIDCKVHNTNGNGP